MKNEKIKGIAKAVATAAMSHDTYEWPPSCLLLTYQPMRPEQRNVLCENMNKQEHLSENRG